MVPKYVVSTTLDHVTWAITTVIVDDATGTVARMQQEPGEDLAICGDDITTETNR